MLQQGDFLTKIDLKDAYLSVPIWTPHQTLLRFEYQSAILEFPCLPFGLASAPRTFTKLLKPVVSQLQKRGVRLINYLDNILIMSASKKIAIEHTDVTINLLSSLSFVVNKKKSVCNLSQEIEILMFLINSIIMYLFLRRDKIKCIKRDCHQLLNIPHSTCLGSLCTDQVLLGKAVLFNSGSLSSRLHNHLLLRAKTVALRKSQSYEAILSLDQAAQQELVWWRYYLVA